MENINRQKQNIAITQKQSYEAAKAALPEIEKKFKTDKGERTIVEDKKGKGRLTEIRPR